MDQVKGKLDVFAIDKITQTFRDAFDDEPAQIVDYTFTIMFDFKDFTISN